MFNKPRRISTFSTGEAIAIPTGDVPTATGGNPGYLMRFAPAIDSTVPRINGFSATPDPAEQGYPITLAVPGMHDPDGRVQSVAIYHDVDGDRRLDTGVDVLLGVDSNGADGWAIDAPSSGLLLGDVQFLVQATYDGGAPSLATSAATWLRLPSTTYVSTDVGQRIRDLSTVTSSLEVPDSFTLGDVDVTVTIEHKINTDLDVFLIHPDGTRVELFTDIGGPVRENTNFTNTTLDDQADDPIGYGGAPYTGRFQPEGLLADLNGKSSSGTWMLEVTDNARKDTGTLVGWSLTLAPDAPIAPSLSIDDVAIEEGNSGAAAAEFTITRSGDLSQTVTVDYQTADGTATAGSDYLAVPPTTLTFAPGVASLPATVTVDGDVDEEPDETFFVNLSNPVGAAISDTQVG